MIKILQGGINRMSENKIEEESRVKFKNERTGKNLGLPEIVTVEKIIDNDWVKLKEDRGTAKLAIDINSLELIEEEKI